MGLLELLVLAAIALLVIGPKQLPEVARNLARFINELKRTTGDLKKNFNIDPDIKKVVKEVTSVVQETEQWVHNQKAEMTNLSRESLKFEIEETRQESNHGHHKENTQEENQDEHEGFAITPKKDS